jgi:hypothetical protein
MTKQNLIMRERPIWVNYFGLAVALFFIVYILINGIIGMDFNLRFDLFLWAFVWLVFLHNFNIIREFDYRKGNGF